MKNICVVHFQPIEKYPPAVNLLRILAKGNKDGRIIQVFTTFPPEGYKIITIPGIEIQRFTQQQKDLARVKRLFYYLQFHKACLNWLRKLKPGTILYYETLSAFAPIMYLKIWDSKVRLLVHYHEYTSPAEYNDGMIVNRLFHWLEYKIYSRVAWVSHTNESRAQLFRKDLGKKAPDLIHAIPNYPPMEWTRQMRNTGRNNNGKIQFVYVGALSTHSMYVKELFEWISDHQDNYHLTIYSDNYTQDVKDLFSNLKAVNIEFMGSVEYDLLPAILPSFDIGLILYNASTLNYKYNAPNKFFEYLNCGLNVVYPDAMVGMDHYHAYYSGQQIKKINFKHLSTFSAAGLKRNPFADLKNACIAENAFMPLLNSLYKN